VGERVFLLQVREGPLLKTLKLEKAQVSALARFLGRMLGELEHPGELPSGDELALEPFGEPDFVVRSLGVSYDDDLDRIILVADEIDRSEVETAVEALFGLADDLETGAEAGESVRLSMTREQAAALAIRGRSSSRRAGPRARSAGTRSMREATCARGRTATARH